MAAQNGNRGAIAIGTFVVLALYIAAIATPNWHTKLYYIAGGAGKAYLHVSLWSYRIECPTSAGGLLNTAAAAVAGAAYCDALTAPRDLVELQANNPQDETINMLVYGGFGCVAAMVIAMACAFLGTGLCFSRPGPAALYLHVGGAVTGLLGLGAYVACSGNLSKFMDPDFLANATFVLNDADKPVTLDWSYFLALTAAILSFGLVYCVHVFVNGVKSGEAAGLLDKWDPSWGAPPQDANQWQQQDWQQPQQQWGQQPQQPQQQWGQQPQQPQQQWGQQPQQQWGW